jgi:acetyl-CoA C-acetyltransferase
MAELGHCRDDRTPILVGAGQLVQRDVELSEALKPQEMLERVARSACDDAGAGDRLLRELDSIALVTSYPNRANNPVRLLAERIGARPAREYVSEVGGQIGVTIANFIAERITRGEAGTALIAGCNNLKTVARARQAGVELDWASGGEGEPELVGELKMGNSKYEARYGLDTPPQIYPIFENALRARRGLDLETHRKQLGELFSPFSKVASENPYAWFPTYRSPDELTTVTPQNRMIAFPYPKYLNAVLATDQAAGLVMTSVAAARALGIPEERWVYWWGGAEAVEQAWWPSERPDFAACPAMLDSSAGALANAGVGIDEIGHIDFYSCFPVAVEMACEMLGIELNDPRGFTVTGGLPYAGGPASAYTLHSLAVMLQRLRDDPGSKGLVTGNGWYLTKHSAGVWSSEPRSGDAPPAELPDPLPSAGLEKAPCPAVEEASGRGVVETYTVIYDREGAPARGIVLGRQADGRRFLANTPGERSLLEAFVAAEQIGREGALSHRDGSNVFDPA